MICLYVGLKFLMCGINVEVCVGGRRKGSSVLIKRSAVLTCCGIVHLKARIILLSIQKTLALYIPRMMKDKLEILRTREPPIYCFDGTINNRNNNPITN